MNTITKTSTIPTADEFRQRLDRLLSQPPVEANASDRNLSQPRAKRAYYDRQLKMVVVELMNDAVHAVPAHLLQGVADKDPDLIDKVEVDPLGVVLHWEDLNADLSVDGILTGWYGSPAWMKHLQEVGKAQVVVTARESGRRGGRSTSNAKLKAARTNGKRGGRPKRARELA